jgi:acyl-CoA thioesterase I
MRMLSMVLTLALAGGSADAAAAPAKDRALKIVALGDSLTSGHRLSKGDAYPALLEKALKDLGLPADVANHGVNGDTSAGGVRRLAAALDEQPQILIVAFGANDGLRGVPVAQVRANLSKIIETAQARGVSVLLVGMEALPLYGWQYTIDFHNLWPELAAKYKVPLVPFMMNGVFGNPDLMSTDGVHPNAAGAKLIAANILTELRPLAQSLVTAAD